MTKMTQEYIDLKIKNCEELIKNAKSKPQREIYEAYLEYWRKEKGEKPKKEPKEPEPVIEPVVVSEPIEEPEAKPNGKVKCSICGKEITVQNIERHEKACKRDKENELEMVSEVKKIATEREVELKAEIKQTEKPNI